MKTYLSRNSFWLIISAGVFLICYSWSDSFRKSTESFINRQAYESFLIRQINSFIDGKGLERQEAVGADMPDMAALQDYFMTVDPELKRVPKERLKSSYEYTKSIQESVSYKSTEQLVWQGTESDIGGRVRALMWDPNDPEGKKVWAGGVTGGLWYNNDITDDASPWIPVGDFWPNLAISCITHDPNNPETFYVGTGEAQTALIIYRESSGLGFGILKSEDAGQTWTILEATTDFAYVTDLMVKDEDGSSVVYAGVVSGTYKGVQHLSEPSDGLFRSADGGQSWEQVLPDITGLDTPYSPSDIELGPSGRIFVGTMQNANGEGGATILYSDLGTTGTWTKYEEYKILIENTPDFNLPGRVILDAAPSDENIVYCAVVQGYFYGIPGYECHILAKSTDKGETWNMFNIPPNGSNGNWAYIAWHALTLSVDPNDPDRLWVAALDTWRTDNEGQTWSKKSNWTAVGNYNYIHGDIHAIAFNGNSSDEFMVASDGGVFYTSEGSENFPTFEEKNHGFNTLQFYKCALHPIADATFYMGGMQDNGTVFYDGNAIGNQNRMSGGDGGACFIDKNEPDVWVTSHQNNNFYLFANYQYLGTAFNWSSGNFISSMDYDFNLNTLYANAVTVVNTLPDQILRLSGIPFGPLEGEFLNLGTDSEVPFTHVKYSEYSPAGTARLFLGTQSGRLFRVENAQADFEVSEIGDPAFPAGAISCVAHGGSDDTLLVTFSNYGVASLWQSYDGGQGWEEKEGDLPDMPVRWALYHPQTATTAMLATEIGVWTSYNLDDEFVNWIPENDGLANVRVDMLQLRDEDLTVLAATHGRGFFTTTFE
ncbi:MAG: exo-alpha-sialidase, partial [Bacteroidales bacterium]|nr:exo-alpha-sialidase [Bacteroidales bacterium]